MIWHLADWVGGAAGVDGGGGEFDWWVFVVRRDWSRKYLQYFMALGAGYMLAVAFIDVIPESVRLRASGRFCWC